MKHSYAFRIVLVGAVSWTLFVLTGCPWDPNPFTRGLRISAREQVFGVANSDFPVAGVPINGASQGNPGPGNTGTGFTINGETGHLGLSDFPDAVTDVDWSISADFSFVIKNCPPAAGVSHVPGQGGEAEFTCTVF